jgi:hypothetical protein
VFSFPVFILYVFSLSSESIIITSFSELGLFPRNSSLNQSGVIWNTRFGRRFCNFLCKLKCMFIYGEV